MDEFHAKLLNIFPSAPFLFSLEPSINLEDKFTDEKVIFIKIQESVKTIYKKKKVMAGYLII